MLALIDSLCSTCSQLASAAAAGDQLHLLHSSHHLWQLLTGSWAVITVFAVCPVPLPQREHVPIVQARPGPLVAAVVV
jgi:hypothetical protein